jgi:D-aspartate ligase
MNSRIIDYTAVDRADQPDVLPRLVEDFARAYPDQRILVIGCGDNYVRQISLASDGFPANVIRHYMEFSLLDRLANKQSFYELCDQGGITHPATFIYDESTGGRLDLGFEPPYIVKPANSVTWWENPFVGQRKVHLEKDLAGLKTLLSTIYAHGYPDSMIIQEYIPGNDSQVYTVTQYYDSAGVMRLNCVGRVLLEEHTAHGFGNSAVTLSVDLPELDGQLSGLLLANAYRGYACFDIKFDERDQQFKVFEVNTRQPRSNYYVTGSNMNITKFIVEDLVYGRQLEPELQVSDPYLWHVTSKQVARQCASQAGLLAAVDALIDNGRSGNPLDYAADRHPARRLWLARYTYQQGRKYQEYRQDVLNA